MQRFILKMKMRFKRKSLKNKMNDCFLFLDLAYPFSEVNQRLDLGCESLSEYLRIVLGDVYNPLRNHLSDIKILKFSNWKDSLSKKINKTYLYEGIYPSVLLIAYGFLLLIYTYVFLPSIEGLMSDLKAENHLLKQMHFQLRIHWILIIVLIIILLLTIYLFKNDDVRVLLYLKLHQSKLYQPIKLIWTHQFVLYYKTFYEETLDSKTILALIREIPSPLSAAWLSYHVDHSFSKGKKWSLDYLDEFFVLRISRCTQYKETIQALDDFLKMSEHQIDRYFNYFIKTMKGGISLCLIAIITLYYQTLYLPLTILQTL